MDSLLAGLRVVLVGSSRPLAAAARWYTDLGADVMVRAGSADRSDTIWLGIHARAPERATVDLSIAEHGADDRGLLATTCVRFSSTSSSAAEPRLQFGERRLAAASGVAIAIGEPDRPPLPAPEGCLDHLVGTHVAAAGLAALLDGSRETEVSAVDVIAWTVATNRYIHTPYDVPWFRAGRRATGSGGCYPYGLFDAADGQVCLIGRTRHDWDALVLAMGEPSWTREARYNDLRAMAIEYPNEVDDRLAPWLLAHTRKELVRLTDAVGFPGAPVLRPDEVLSVPSIAHNWRSAQSVGSDARHVQVPGAPFNAATVATEADPPNLAGLLVLDLSWVWSGPAVGTALADLGATVVKVESRSRLDNSRLRGQPTSFKLAAGAPESEVAPYFHAVNRGKLSVTLNLKSEGGLALLARLACQADVIIENLRPHVMRQFGISPERVHEMNPGCVFLSMPGYRKHPTTEGLRAYAPVLSAGAGIESLVSYPGEPPVGMMTYGLSDANAASQGILLVLAGLWSRCVKAVGSAIVLSQFDAAVLANGHNLVNAQVREVEAGLAPLVAETIVAADGLASSPWTSADLFTDVRTRWLGDLQVARLPWRRDGTFPVLSGAGPEVGADTCQVLTGRLGMTSATVETLGRAGSLT